MDIRTDWIDAALEQWDATAPPGITHSVHDFVDMFLMGGEL